VTNAENFTKAFAVLRTAKDTARGSKLVDHTKEKEYIRVFERRCMSKKDPNFAVINLIINDMKATHGYGDARTVETILGMFIHQCRKTVANNLKQGQYLIQSPVKDDKLKAVDSPKRNPGAGKPPV
jgi:hypothetical protein